MQKSEELLYTVPTDEVESIRINDDAERGVVNELKSKIDDVLKSQRWGDFIKDCAIAIAQYEASLDRSGHNPDSCRVDVPSTSIFLDAAVSRFKNMLFTHEEIWVGRPSIPGQSMEKLCQQFADMSQVISLNHGLESYREFVGKSIYHLLLFPRVAIKVMKEDRSKVVNDYYYLEDEDSKPKWGLDQDLDYEGEKRKGAHRVKLESRTFRKVIDPRNLVFPMPISDISRSPFIAEKVFFTRCEIEELIKAKLFKKDFLDKIGEPTSVHMTLDIDDNEEVIETPKSGDFKQYELYEVYFKHKDREAVILFEKESGAVAYFVYNWRDDYQRPYIVRHFRGVIIESSGGRSLARRVEPQHRLISELTRQELDAGSFANMLVGFISKDAGLSTEIENGYLKPGWHVVNSMTPKNAIHIARISEPYTRSPALRNEQNILLQKQIGMSPYSLGFEQIDRPTAKGVQMLLEEGSQTWYDIFESIRSMLADVLYIEISVYKQMHPEGWSFFVNIGEEVRSVVLNWQVDYWENQIVLETRMSSKRLSKEVKRKEFLGVIDKLPEIFKIVLDLISVVESGQGASSGVALTLLEYYIKSALVPMLDSFGLDVPKDVEEILSASKIAGEVVNNAVQQANEANTVAQEATSKVQELSILVAELSSEFHRKTNKAPETLLAARAKQPFELS